MVTVVLKTARSCLPQPLSDRVLLPGSSSGVIIAPIMPLTPGTKLGPYEIGVPLGAGGMGEVYRARDTRLDRTVAIKILPEQFSADPIRKQRFEREAKTISSLNHPHICVLYDVGHQEGTDYLVMECLEGETLAKRLEKGPLPLEQALKYGAQIADAIDSFAPLAVSMMFPGLRSRWTMPRDAPYNAEWIAPLLFACRAAVFGSPGRKSRRNLAAGNAGTARTGMRCAVAGRSSGRSGEGSR